jgi:threonyl-tRNA synthetase
MKEIIAEDKPIIKMNIDRMEAMKYFEKVGDDAKAGVMKYNTNNYVTLYRLGNLYNYFYNLMPRSTALVKDFDLTYIKDNGFILRFPKEKEHITGYQYESWHYRYCGIECATYIYNNEITFEEYYEYFIKYKNPKNLS